MDATLQGGMLSNQVAHFSLRKWLTFRCVLPGLVNQEGRGGDALKKRHRQRRETLPIQAQDE